MDQATRQRKYDEFWSWVGNRYEKDPVDGIILSGDIVHKEAVIDLLLHTLTDIQLDEVLAEITEAGGFQMRVIELPVLGIKIKLSRGFDSSSAICKIKGGRSSPGEIDFDDSLSARCPKCGQKDCLYQCDGAHLGEVESEDDVISRISGNGAIDALMALILAHAVAGVDVETPAYLEGIETAIEAILNSS